jgi:tripeptidyl-peptidase-1
VVAWLKQNGVSDVTFPNADMVEVSTTAGVASQLFDANFSTFVHTETATVLSRCEGYALPEAIADVVQVGR